MRKSALTAGILTAAMAVLSACSGMPGMGNAQPAPAQDAKAEGGAEAADTDKVYELKISTSQTEQALITRKYRHLQPAVGLFIQGICQFLIIPGNKRLLCL